MVEGSVGTERTDEFGGGTVGRARKTRAGRI